ncbi:MAG: nucleotidyltransferase family protein [Clostridium sp.]|nr:nucleotidyltransferase family protein [Clostridium sp.]MCM1207436.1 nucleotidyltransferase family protein [Ruminococcus sp.]
MKIEEICIDEDKTIIQAMKQLDELATKILFVLCKGRLAATLTDGDIRRWILAGGELTASVRNAANYKPHYLQNATAGKARQFLKDNYIEAVPVVNEDFVIEQIFFADNKNIRSSKLEIPIVMMAGGMGTRLYPYTKILPKPLIPVGEIPIAERIINKYVEYGCRDFYLIVNHKKNMIKAYFNEIEKNYNVYYIDEEKPLGTGGGLSMLKGRINNTFVLTNCDILINEDFVKIYKFHKEQKNVITMICSLKNFKIPYGIVEIGEVGEIKTMREKPELSFFTNTGCYIVEPEVIDGMNDNEMVNFPDIIEKHKNMGEKVSVYPIGEKAWLDMGQMDELERMRNALDHE